MFQMNCKDHFDSNLKIWKFNKNKLTKKKQRNLRYANCPWTKIGTISSNSPKEFEKFENKE